MIPAAHALPALRDDLGILPGPEARDGTPTWTIHDASRNRYFRIGHAAFEMLTRWHLADPAVLLARTQAETGLALQPADLDWLVQFLDLNHLLRRENAYGLGRLGADALKERKDWYSWLLHNYLFFRIPLVRPDRFLAATLPWVAPLFSRGLLVAVGMAWVIGLLLVLRQWDVFLATVPQFLNWQGALWFAGALAVSKVTHELGHAYAVRRYGGRVPTMGVAFLVMFPVLYTDTSDSWRLVSRRQRLVVGGAGMAAEMALGGLAVLMWSFLPDGSARDAAFSMATVTIVATLTMNLTPFLRFDGYYLLSDALGVENLQSRAFALARWALRGTLLGVKEPAPEYFSPRMRTGLLAYAYATWVYRLVLFVGIALLVYHTFFKLLGLFLFVVEIVWFVLKPVWAEMGEWWKRRHAIERGRLRLSVAIGMALLLVLAVPWRSNVDLPAVARAGTYTIVYPPVTGYLQHWPVRQGDGVEAGTVIAEMASPDLAIALTRVETRIALQRALLMREVASTEARQSIHVLRSQLAALQRERDGLLHTAGQLTIRSPVAGEVVEVLPAGRQGLWVSPTVPLVYVAAREAPEITAFLAEEDLRRLKPGASARFIADDPSLPSWPCEIVTISDVNIATLDTLLLASTYGGPIAVRPDANDLPVPTKGYYRVVLRFTDGLPDYEKATRGIVIAEADNRSPLGRMVDVVASVLIRESGF